MATKVLIDQQAVNELGAPLLIAHCDCGQREFKGFTPEKEIRKDLGTRCVDCGSSIIITRLTPRSAPLGSPDLSYLSWLGI